LGNWKLTLKEKIMVNLVLSSSGKIQDVTHNGKPVKKSYIRGLRKAQETSYWKRFTTPEIGVNRFSGVEVNLDDFEATVYNFCMQWCTRYEQGINPEAPIQTFDDMKYLLLEINPNAYFDLLD
jgi:hypothetical protein